MTEPELIENDPGEKTVEDIEKFLFDQNFDLRHDHGVEVTFIRDESIVTRRWRPEIVSRFAKEIRKKISDRYDLCKGITFKKVTIAILKVDKK
jgi:hypothetical protein